MRYRLSEIEATGPRRFYALRLVRPAIGILVIDIHILKSGVLKSPEYLPVKSRSRSLYGTSAFSH